MTGSRGSGGFSFDHSLVSRAVGTMFDAEILDRCHSFDPWEGAEYEECELDKRVRGGRMDTSGLGDVKVCLLYTSPSPRDRTRSRMPSSA